jgi:hypothetical protein
MMRPTAVTALVLACVVQAGCYRHLVFVENSHFGLKASFEPNNPTPAEVDLGWRRAMFAMVPQKSSGDTKSSPGSVTVERSADDNGKTTITIVPDPNELMSMYAVYQGNIGFNDPVEIYHFMATGVAASNLLANDGSLRQLVRRVNAQNVDAGGAGGGEDGNGAGEENGQ